MKRDFFQHSIVMSDKAKSLITKLLASAKEEGVSKINIFKLFKQTTKKQVGHIVTLYE